MADTNAEMMAAEAPRVEPQFNEQELEAVTQLRIAISEVEEGTRNPKYGDETRGAAALALREAANLALELAKSFEG